MFLFLLDSNNTVVSLLVVLIILTMLAFFIPNGTSNKELNDMAGSGVYMHPTTSHQGAQQGHDTEITTQGRVLERAANQYTAITKSYCLFVTMVPLIWSLYLWSIYDATGHVLQMVVTLERLHISFGVDSVSLSLTVLTTALFPICIMLMRTFKGYVTFLLLEIVIYGALNVLDLLGFYILFEASLILLFVLIGRTPYGNIEAAYKIVLYTMAGSLILLPIIFVLYALGGSTSLIYLTLVAQSTSEGLSGAVLDTAPDSLGNIGTHTGGHSLALYQSTEMQSGVIEGAWIQLPERQMILGWGLFLVFAVKIPLMPVHLWLPEAHVAAPTAGSVLLAGVLLKLGGIGFIRFMIPILPTFTASIFPLVCCMCLASFLYSTLSTIRQIDLKKIVAYSSIGHMALITLAIFTMSEYSAYNATFMMVAHGLVSPCLFLLVGLLYDRFHTKYVLYFTGLGAHMPLFSTFFFLCTLANLSFPLAANFVAEILCLASIFSIHPLYAYVFCICQVLGTVASFWAFNRIIHGNSKGFIPAQGSLQYICDLSRYEILLVLPLLIGVYWLGIKPMA